MTPGFKIRAVQLDLARQMETTDFICRFIDFIADHGYNTLFLYLEWRVRTRTFDIGSEQGYSAAEMTAIIEYAGQRGITVIPGLATMGHANLLLSNPDFAHFGELYSGTAGHLGDQRLFELCLSHPDLRRLLENYITDIAEIFPGEYIHIGGDEAFNFAVCPRCREAVSDQAGVLKLFVDHINFCCDIVTGKLRRRMMMFDDMLEFYPDAVYNLSRDIIMVNWFYHQNITSWIGHFDNRNFGKKLAYYEDLGFEYLIAPADYYWNNIESFTLSIAGRRCLGGLLTIWEKEKRLMSKYLPIIAAAGRLWSAESTEAAQLAVDDTMNEFISPDRPLLKKALRQYLDNPDKGVGISEETMLSHTFDGPNWEYLHSLETQIAIFEAAGSFKNNGPDAVYQDILRDLKMQLASARLAAASYRMLHGQEAESLDDIAGDISRIWDENIAACRLERNDHFAADFCRYKQEDLSLIANFRRNLVEKPRFEVLFSLPDAYEGEYLNVEFLIDGVWEKTAAGVFKNLQQALYRFTFFADWQTTPEAVRLSAYGFGGVGVCYLQVFMPDGRILVPGEITSADGKLYEAENILHPDCTCACFGYARTMESVHDRARCRQLHILQFTLCDKPPAVAEGI